MNIFVDREVPALEVLKNRLANSMNKFPDPELEELVTGIEVDRNEKVAVFEDHVLESFLAGADGSSKESHDVVGHAFIMALMSQALRECGREVVVNDNGILITPAPVTATILRVIELELERLKIK